MSLKILMMILRIYSDKSYIPPQTAHVNMLCPFWGINPEALEPYPNAYSNYVSEGEKIFELVNNIEEADCIIAPVAWEKNIQGQLLTSQFAELASPNKPIVIFFHHDSDEPIPVPNSVIFRTSFYKSQQKPTEYALPTWNEDPLKVHNQDQLVIREKQSTPVLGFCGYVITPNMNIIQYVKDIGRYIKDGIHKTNAKRQKRAYHVFRGKIVQRLKKSKRIQTNFIIRHQFYGVVTTLQRHQYNQEFFQNTIDSDYILCVRGAGNFSYRLYETLACGRIPVFVNTDCVLPYDFEIDWKQYCVWIEANEIDLIEQKVRDFHDKLSPEAFIALQKNCRKLWEDYLSPEGFFRNFYRHFKKETI
ncbi:MAG: exostosin family protein [bacterium]|nr:exostosin family protein [bacterium]